MNDSSTGESAHSGATLARDIMTTGVVSVPAAATVRDIARLLLDRKISAVPVCNADGVPVGMVSEGDLIGRTDAERLARNDWWLALASGSQKLDKEITARLEAADRTARDIMSSPVVTVTEDTDVTEIARLFAVHHIKRVPVVRDGRAVGIVSRADLLHVVAAGSTAPAAREHKAAHKGFLASLFGEYRLPVWETVAGNQPPSQRPTAEEKQLVAGDFRDLVEDFQHGEAQQMDETRRNAARQRRERAKELIDAHITDDRWRQMLHSAREAAESGHKEYMLLRFPNQVCIDAARAINVAEKDWPSTLRGTPAEIYLRWERDLKPRGFGLSARVLEFPDGKPGDVGLFLIWGE